MNIIYKIRNFFWNKSKEPVGFIPVDYEFPVKVDRKLQAEIDKKAIQKRHQNYD